MSYASKPEPALAGPGLWDPGFSHSEILRPTRSTSPRAKPDHQT
jgi:hypothetical protein